MRGEDVDVKRIMLLLRTILEGRIGGQCWRGEKWQLLMRILPHRMKRMLLLRTIVGGRIRSKSWRGEKRRLLMRILPHLTKTVTS